jgi:hypothetical protein
MGHIKSWRKEEILNFGENENFSFLLVGKKNCTILSWEQFGSLIICIPDSLRTLSSGITWRHREACLSNSIFNNENWKQNIQHLQNRQFFCNIVMKWNDQFWLYELFHSCEWILEIEFFYGNTLPWKSSTIVLLNL